jgi:hypothetical protein
MQGVGGLTGSNGYYYNEISKKIPPWAVKTWDEMNLIYDCRILAFQMTGLFLAGIFAYYERNPPGAIAAITCIVLPLIPVCIQINQLDRIRKAADNGLKIN